MLNPLSIIGKALSKVFRSTKKFNIHTPPLQHDSLRMSYVDSLQHLVNIPATLGAIFSAQQIVFLGS